MNECKVCGERFGGCICYKPSETTEIEFYPYGDCCWQELKKSLEEKNG